VEGFPATNEALSRLSLLINTIPAPTLSGEQLRNLPKEAILIELASGIQFPNDTDHTLILGHGLPGKILPREAGRALSKIAF
jgi:dipicolinate synthase subunit A